MKGEFGAKVHLAYETCDVSELSSVTQQCRRSLLAMVKSTGLSTPAGC